MKRILLLLLATCVAVSLLFVTACGNASDANRSSVLINITNISGGDGVPGQDGTGVGDTEDEDISFGLVYSHIKSVGSNYDTLGNVSFRSDPNGDGTEDLEGQYGNVILRKYRVSYQRTDGRNTPGFDVPYPFDGACNIFLDSSQEQEGDMKVENIIFVRGTAKDEPPLSWLTTQQYGEDAFMAEMLIEFWGEDYSGNNIYVKGQNLVEFICVDCHEPGPDPDPDPDANEYVFAISADPLFILPYGQSFISTRLTVDNLGVSNQPVYFWSSTGDEDVPSDLEQFIVYTDNAGYAYNVVFATTAQVGVFSVTAVTTPPGGTASEDLQVSVIITVTNNL